MVAYGEFRGSFAKDPEDSRFVFYGMRYLVENYLVPWTEHDVEMAAAFYATHNAGFQPFPFPKDLFLKFVRENNGYFPVRIEALPEGTVANVHVPVYQIFAEKEYARLITFLETILTQCWYPSTVATLSRRTRDLIEEGFKQTVDDEDMWQIPYKLHDFGFRGCTCVEQSVIGGCAHLLSFSGSDTMVSARAEGRPPGGDFRDASSLAFSSGGTGDNQARAHSCNRKLLMKLLFLSMLTKLRCVVLRLLLLPLLLSVSPRATTHSII